MGALKDTFAKFSTRMHRSIYRTSNGRVLGTAFGMPVLELTTRGRQSGKTRHTMVAAPICEDERIVLVASYDGAPKHPAWYLNLRSDPSVTVTMKGQPRSMVARTASPEEKAVLWPAITEASDAYAKAQAKTSREIPVVILTPGVS